jgi:hypothetical protein
MTLPTIRVMPGLVPGIHVLPLGSHGKKDVDGRDKPGHDESEYFGGGSPGHDEAGRCGVAA